MTGIHPSWEKAGAVAFAIMKGEHDDELESIRQAAVARLKSRFRKGQHCKLVGTRNVSLDGQECVIEKVNQKSISVRVLSTGAGYNVPSSMLEVA